MHKYYKEGVISIICRSCDDFTPVLPDCSKCDKYAHQKPCIYGTDSDNCYCEKYLIKVIPIEDKNYNLFLKGK